MKNKIEKAEKKKQEKTAAENRKYIQSIAPDLKNKDAVAALVENKLNVEDRTEKYNRMVGGGALLGSRTGHDFGNYYGNNDAEKLYQELTGLSKGDEGYLKRGKKQKYSKSAQNQSPVASDVAHVKKQENACLTT